MIVHPRTGSTRNSDKLHAKRRAVGLLLSDSRDLYKRYSLAKHLVQLVTLDKMHARKGKEGEGGGGGTRWSMAGSLNFFTVYKRRGKSFRCFRGIGKFPRIIPRVILRI